MGDDNGSLPEVVKAEVAHRRTLTECEAVMEENYEAAEAFALAFAEIKRRKLYQSEYTSFEEYCLKRWNRSVSTGKRWALQGETLRKTGALPAVRETDGTANAERETSTTERRNSPRVGSSDQHVRDSEPCPECSIKQEIIDRQKAKIARLVATNERMMADLQQAGSDYNPESYDPEVGF